MWVYIHYIHWKNILYWRQSQLKKIWLLLYWVDQKVHLLFSIRWLRWCLVVLNFIWNNFVRLYCDSCHISVHFFKNLSKLVNFCVAILMLKMEENMQHFIHIMLYYLKKDKNVTGTHKKVLCSIWRRCYNWLNVSKVVCEVSWWRFLAGQYSTVWWTSWSW